MTQALLQVTGLSRSAADVRLPDLVYGVPVLCPLACADVLAIEAESLVSQRGVRGLLTEDSVLAGRGQRFQPLLGQLLSKRVRRAGQVVALVLADSPLLAKSVARQVSLRIREQAGPLTIQAAIATAGPSSPVRRSSGQPAEAFANASTRLRQTYRTSARLVGDVAHGTATAVWRGDSLTVYAIGASKQALGTQLGLPEDKLLVVSSELGDSRSLTSTSSLLAVIASAHLDRPVSVELPALCAAGTLPETIQTLQLGLSADDRPSALLLHGAVAGSFSAQPSELSVMDLGSAYGFADRELSLVALPVHLPISDRFVGIELALSLEVAIDELATQHGEDPLQLRLRWLSDRPEGASLHRCLTQLQKLLGDGKPSSPSPKDASSDRLLGRKLGVGMAAAVWRSAAGSLQFGAHAIEVAVSSGRIELVRHACVLETDPGSDVADSVVRKSLAWARKVALRRALVLHSRSGWTSSSPEDAARSSSVANLAVRLIPAGSPGTARTNPDDLAMLAASGVAAAIANALSSALGVRQRTVCPSVVDGTKWLSAG
jgi:CO/xanthine dehydrogenase Mo-binding subunit